MALFNWRRKAGSPEGKIIETNPRKPYGFETLPQEQREFIADTELKAGSRANDTEIAHRDLMTSLYPEHTLQFKQDARDAMSNNTREIVTRRVMLHGTSIQDLDRMYKAENAAHKAKQRANGVPEHEIMDLPGGIEVSGDAINRLKAGEPPKLSTD
jgi:hypothetical protein